MLKISECSENCKKACWKFQNVLKTVMHVVCLKFQRIKTMLNISGCVENMLKISRHVENYNMCRKLCWNSMLKISHVLNTVTLAESHVKTSRRIENVYVRHVENHIENHVEVRKKDHHTLQHVSKLSGRFRFSPSVCTSYWSETYASRWYNQRKGRRSKKLHTTRRCKLTVSPFMSPTSSVLAPAKKKIK